MFTLALELFIVNMKRFYVEVVEMVVITKITTQKRNRDRYNIFIDDGTGEKYGFSVDEAILIKFNLQAGLQLSNQDLEELNYEDNFRQGLNRAINYLARRMRSKGEIRTHLAEHDINEQTIERIIVKLTELNYVNDEQFTKAYIATQINTTEKGPINIRRELQEKGVNETIINKKLAKFSQDEQIKRAVQLADKYVVKLTRDSQQGALNKTRQMLIRRGYPAEVISIAIEEIAFTRTEADELQALRPHGDRAYRRFRHLDKYEREQKIKQSLFRRGFPLQLIEKFLSEQREQKGK